MTRNKLYKDLGRITTDFIIADIVEEKDDYCLERQIEGGVDLVFSLLTVAQMNHCLTKWETGIAREYINKAVALVEGVLNPEQED